MRFEKTIARTAGVTDASVARRDSSEQGKLYHRKTVRAICMEVLEKGGGAGEGDQSR